MAKQRIRVLALGIIQSGDRLFLSEGHDPAKGGLFYRALGGGIDFGETSYDALQREFREEIQAELTNIQYLGCVESLFTFNQTPHHEIIQLYSCDFADPRFYELEQLTFQEGKRTKVARWVERSQFETGALTLYPTSCLELLK
jgi:8-oxo-dGTP pyrophosphatase MutT (NUDIX family)